MIVDDLPVVVRIRLGEYRAPRNGTRNLGAYPAAATRNVQFLQSIDPKKADQFLDPFARFHNRTDLGYVVVTSPVNIRHDVEKEIKDITDQIVAKCDPEKIILFKPHRVRSILFDF